MFGRKKQKFFGNSIEPSCKYCANYREYGEDAVCKAGRKPEGGEACPQFSYDPLRRSPVVPPPLKKHDPDEFKL